MRRISEEMTFQEPWKMRHAFSNLPSRVRIRMMVSPKNSRKRRHTLTRTQACWWRPMYLRKWCSRGTGSSRWQQTWSSNKSVQKSGDVFKEVIVNQTSRRQTFSNTAVWSVGVAVNVVKVNYMHDQNLQPQKQSTTNVVVTIIYCFGWKRQQHTIGPGARRDSRWRGDPSKSSNN